MEKPWEHHGNNMETGTYGKIMGRYMAMHENIYIYTYGNIGKDVSSLLSYPHFSGQMMKTMDSTRRNREYTGCNGM